MDLKACLGLKNNSLAIVSILCKLAGNLKQDVDGDDKTKSEDIGESALV